MEAIGDVKYSILEPGRFMQLNPGWVLMDGRNISGSTLANDFGVANLPDARGMFIRAMNMGRTIGGDSEIDRTVGSRQEDAFKSHTHTAELRQTNNAPFGAGPFINPVEPQRPTSTHHSVVIDSTGGAETRPRNIALFLYIKIN